MIEFKIFYNALLLMEAKEIEIKFPFLGKRSKSIKGGAFLGMMIGKKLGIKTFEISTRGLRYGTLFEGEIKNGFRK